MAQASFHNSRRPTNIFEPMLISKSCELRVVVEVMDSSGKVKINTLGLDKLVKTLSHPINWRNVKVKLFEL